MSPVTALVYQTRCVRRPSAGDPRVFCPLLDRFEELDSEKAQLVKLRYFVGMTLVEAADAMGISRATVSRHWTFAKAWLANELHKN